MSGYESELDALRQRIDAIDVQVLALLNARATVVSDIYVLKERHGAPRFNRARTDSILERLVSVSVDASELESAAADYERQVSLAVQSDPDVAAFVERLEQAAEQDSRPLGPGDLPSGDALASEFQRFLRQQGPER